MRSVHSSCHEPLLARGAGLRRRPPACALGLLLAAGCGANPVSAPDLSGGDLAGGDLTAGDHEQPGGDLAAGDHEQPGGDLAGGDLAAGDHEPPGGDLAGGDLTSGDAQAPATPVAVLADLPALLTNDPTAAITVSGAGVVEYRFALDGGTWSAARPVATVLALAGLSDGPHSLAVVGGDGAGTWQAAASPTSHTWVVDTLPPIVLLSQLPSDPTISTAIAVLVGGEQVVAYRARLDGGTWSGIQPVGTPISRSGLGGGPHSLAVIGADAADNWQAAAAASTHDWTITTGGVLVNLALGKPTYASSVTDPASANTDQHVTDGELLTAWQSDWTGRPGAYVEVLLGDWYEVHELVLHLGTNGTSGAHADYQVQYWDGCWQPVPGTTVVGHASTPVLETYPVAPPVVTTRLRFVCTDVARCQLRELEANGAGPVARPSGPMTCPAGQQVVGHHPLYGFAQFFPAGYNANRDAPWPIVFAYHGIGGMILDSTYSAVQAWPEGLSRRIAGNATFRATLGAIVISPHCRAVGSTSGDCWFNTAAIGTMLHQLLRDYQVDLDRVSVTGLSGGGIRGWELVIRNRERIAAFIPVCADLTTAYLGWGPWPDYDPIPAADGRHFCDLVELPIWGFHGTADTVVNYSSARATAALDDYMNTRCDAASDLFSFDATDYEGWTHAIWDDVYGRDELYPWLLSRRVSERSSP